MLSLPPASGWNREWLCKRFLPAIAAQQTLGLSSFLVLLAEASERLAKRPVCAEHHTKAQTEDSATQGDTASLAPVPVLVFGPLRGHVDAARLLAVALARNPLAEVVFLGDYVDGGDHSVETLSLALMALCALPAGRVSVLRGRHEHLFPSPASWSGAVEARLDADLGWRCVQHNNAVAAARTESDDDSSRRVEPTAAVAASSLAVLEEGIIDELQVRQALVRCFASMPLAATINGRFFCCAGGPSHTGMSVEELNALDRFAPRDSPECRIINDLVASSPADEDDEHRANRDGCGFMFTRNPETRHGALYTYRGACHFLRTYDYLTIIRGSFLPMFADPPPPTLARPSENDGKYSRYDPGFRMYPKTPIGSPSVLSLFSAPRLAGSAHNLGAYAVITGNSCSVHQFEADIRRAPQLPGQHRRSAFDWSFPIVVQGLLSVLTHIGLPDTEREDAASDAALEAELLGKVSRFRRLCRWHQRAKNGAAAASEGHQAPEHVSNQTPADTGITDSSGQGQELKVDGEPGGGAQGKGAGSALPDDNEERPAESPDGQSLHVHHEGLPRF